MQWVRRRPRPHGYSKWHLVIEWRSGHRYPVDPNTPPGPFALTACGERLAEPLETQEGAGEATYYRGVPIPLRRDGQPVSEHGNGRCQTCFEVAWSLLNSHPTWRSRASHRTRS